MPEALVTSLEGQKQSFFHKVDALVGKGLDFAVMTYPQKTRTLLKISLDGEAEFAPEFSTPDWRNQLARGNDAGLLFYHLFTKDMITGDITLEEIRHDAIPAGREAAEFFKPHPESLHRKDPPMGFEFGRLTFESRSGDRITLKVVDLRMGELSGDYEMIFSDRIMKDKKERDAIVVRLRKLSF